MFAHYQPAADGRVARLTRLVLRHRRAVAAFWLILTLAGLASAGRAYRALSDQYTVPGREGYETNAAIARTFGTGGNGAPLVPVVTLPPGVTVDSPPVRSGLAELTTRIQRAVPHVRVASYASTGDRAFVSRDGRTTFLVAYPPPEKGAFGQSPKAVNAARAAIRDVQVGGAPVHLTGLDALAAESGGHGGIGLLAEALIGGFGALVVLTFVFASWLAVVPLLIALISIMTSFLLVWALTAVTSVSALVGFLIALVGLGVAIDYSLLIVTRWREERARGHLGEEAVVRAMATAGRAVVFSGTTVAVGLLALVALPLPFLRSVGYAGMLIPLTSVVVTLTLLPVILVTFGHRLDWPHRRSDHRASRSWTRWATLVVRRRWVAATLGIAVLGAFLAAATTLRLGAAAGEPDTISQRGDARQGLVALEQSGIGGGVLTPIEILTDSPDRAALAQRLQSLDGVHGATAPAAATWRHGPTTVVDVYPQTDSSTTVGRVRDVAHRVATDARVGGITAQNSDFITATYRSFPLMIVLIALLTTVLLARAFRSILLPIKAVLLNVASVAAAWGVLALVWQHGYGAGAMWDTRAVGTIPSWLPLVVFAFLFGLSMDYEVFILARIREEYDATGSTDTAVVRGMARTGRLVTSAALILFLGFLAMSTAPNTSVKMMATGLGAGIIIDATIVRSLLVPAAVALFGRWNWWLPSSLARALRVSGAGAAEVEPVRA
jgi:RND superfamily putative drug exporter